MAWNYRIMRHNAGSAANDEAHYFVHEVYYQDDGSVLRWTEDGVGCSGETVAELSKDIAWYLTALVKPVLDYATGEEVEPAQLLEDDIYAMMKPGSEMARQAVRQHGAERIAQAIEARRAATTGAVHESAVPAGDAPNGGSDA